MDEWQLGLAPSPASADEVTPDIRVAFILSPDFTLLPFAGFIDALRHAADVADQSRQIYCRWTCLGPDLAPVRSSCGIEVRPWETYGDPLLFDYVVVIGGLLSGFGRHAPETFEFLRLAVAHEVTLVGLCTGSFALAEAGLMDGRRCAVHIRHLQELIERYPCVVPVADELYVSDGPCITCPGGTAAIDLAVELLVRHSGKARALKGLAQMVVDAHRAAHHKARHIYDDIKECGDWRIKRAMTLMQEKLGEPYTIARLARRVGTSVRQLERAFAAHAHMSPAMVWRGLRLEHARWRLLNTTRTITQIADECGFADSSHFARCFRQSYGECPYEFRHRRHRVDTT
ncbi:MAG: GlxA family transcriptional regulator [Arenicellales bacterium]